MHPEAWGEQQGVGPCTNPEPIRDPGDSSDPGDSGDSARLRRPLRMQRPLNGSLFVATVADFTMVNNATTVAEVAGVAGYSMTPVR